MLLARFTFILILTTILICIKGTVGIQLRDYSCRDESNNAVDWWILYILPKKEVGERYRLAFITSNTGRDMIYSEVLLNREDSMLGLTVRQLIQNNPGRENYYVYNDHISDASSNTNIAHAKGLAVFGTRSGFWLWHSIPRFIPLPDVRYSFPNTGFGQVAACVSFNSNPGNRRTIQRHLGAINARCAWRNVPRNVYGPCAREQPNRLVTETPFTSVGGNIFQVYSKSRNTGREIYNDVATRRGRNWNVQSWRANLPDTPRVTKASLVEIRNRFWNYDWESSVDHSKVAISTIRDEFCIGDLNVANTQLRRGGGILCFPRRIVPNGITLH